MKITVISYGKTFNTGNYTSERYDITVDTSDDEKPPDPIKIVRRLKTLVEQMAAEGPTQGPRQPGYEE